MSKTVELRACIVVSCIMLGGGVVVSPARGQCQVAKLTASDMARGDGFGVNDIDGDYIVVGAPGNDDACPSDPDCNSGSAYIFKRVDPGTPWNARDDTWVEQAKLLAPDAERGDLFGARVAISGDYVLLSASRSDDANPGDPACDSGAAYIFRREGDAWLFDAKLTAADGECGDRFGLDLDLDVEFAVIGAPEHQPVDPGSGEGSVYAFRRTSGSWGLETRLIASEGLGLAGLGQSVATCGGVIAARIIDHTAGDAYSVRVYRHVGGTWPLESSLEPIDPLAGDLFGEDIGTDGMLIVVGTEWVTPPPEVASAEQLANPAAGSAHVYRWNGANWIPEAKVVPSDGDGLDAFGKSVTVEDGRVFGGAISHDGTTSGSDTGAAYLFEYNGSSWHEEAKILPKDAAPGDLVGWTSTVNDPFLVVGAALDDDACTNDSSCDSGSAYVYWLGATEECKPIPTLSEIALVVLFGGLLFAGIVQIKKNESRKGLSACP